jgi:DNA replication and repair protein RecF
VIQKIRLNNFRSFNNKTLEFSEKITVIIGPNASGKTNVLEALFLLSTGKSFKARTEAEMLRYGQELARVVGDLLLASMDPVGSSSRPTSSDISPAVTRRDPLRFHHPSRLEVMVTKGDNGWPRKKLLVNGVFKRLIDFSGIFKVVLFGPWDMDLVTETPSLRRKFLDNVLSQVDREYRRCILSYEKGLRQRNRLLFRIREEGAPRSQLLFWNQLLIKTGDYITSKRQEFIDFANSQPSLNDQKFKLEYDRSVISEGRLEQYKDEEVSAATTLVGPHRDDFIFFEKERNLSSYGSRGEQRMGVLWLKIAELEFIEAKMGERPTLLLDDIFSELDHEHREVVMKLSKKQQTVITTADEHFLKGLRPNVIIKL